MLNKVFIVGKVPGIVRIVFEQKESWKFQEGTLLFVACCNWNWIGFRKWLSKTKFEIGSEQQDSILKECEERLRCRYDSIIQTNPIYLKSKSIFCYFCTGCKCWRTGYPTHWSASIGQIDTDQFLSLTIISQHPGKAKRIVCSNSCHGHCSR